jgi:hypothetical protein
LSTDSLASAASLSPMVATRSVAAMAWVVMPSRAASSSRGVTWISGRGRVLSVETLDISVSFASAPSMMATPAFRSSSSVDSTL